MSGYLCVLTMGPDQCAFCGEWVHVEGGDILHNGQWFCSDECVEVIEAQRTAAEHRRIHGNPDWCKACGFDRYEHADNCPSREPEWVPTCHRCGAQLSNPLATACSRACALGETDSPDAEGE